MGNENLDFVLVVRLEKEILEKEESEIQDTLQNGMRIGIDDLYRHICEKLEIPKREYKNFELLK